MASWRTFIFKSVVYCKHTHTHTQIHLFLWLVKMLTGKVQIWTTNLTKPIEKHLCSWALLHRTVFNQTVDTVHTETFAALLGAVLPEIRELHGTAVKELSCWTVNRNQSITSERQSGLLSYQSNELPTQTWWIHLTSRTRFKCGRPVKSWSDPVYHKLGPLRNCCVSGRGFNNDRPHRIIQEHLNNTANVTWWL